MLASPIPGNCPEALRESCANLSNLRYCFTMASQTLGESRKPRLQHPRRAALSKAFRKGERHQTPGNSRFQRLLHGFVSRIVDKKFVSH